MPRKTVVIKNTENPPSRIKTVLVGSGLLVGLALTVGAIVWGRSDTGQIDVSATIVSSRSEVDENGVTTLTPNTSNELAEMPNGGLLPQGGDTVPAPEPPIIVDSTASTSASTTVSSTTEESSETLPEEDGEAVDEEETTISEGGGSETESTTTIE